MSDYLPKEIWANIFHRLSFKSLGRCTCVCKAWKCLISDVEFIHDHFNRTIQANNGIGCFLIHISRRYRLAWLNNFVELYSLHPDNEKLDPPYVFQYPFVDRFANECPRVVGTCNGLVCIVDDVEAYRDSFVIWNPTIRKYVMLPKPRIHYNSKGEYETWVGFGFDSRNKDFEVVRLVTPHCDRYLPELEVYSLATGSWRTIIDATSPFTIYSDLYKVPQPPIFMNGIIHWVVSRESNGQYHNLISTFDVVEERSGELILPRPLKESATCVSILDGGEKLAAVHRYFAESDREFMSIWVMEEYGVVESWKEVFNSDSRCYGGIERVLALRNSGRLMLEGRRGTIILLDLRKNLMRNPPFINTHRNLYVGLHGRAGSLFLLNKENVVSY